MKESLFPQQLDQNSANTPLAEKMRPRTLDEFEGQRKLLGSGRFLTQILDEDQIPSIIFWGPPGVGKTTLARIIAANSSARFVALSAVLSGVKEVKQVMQEARYHLETHRLATILFIDEIHRFNKAQQDAFLPHVESGRITLIGATTENPSFEIISPLLSRCRVLVLESLTEEDICRILQRALRDFDRGLGDWNVRVSDEVLRAIANFSNGDARIALNGLEQAARLARRQDAASPRITAEVAADALQRRTLLYDKSGEEHFNLISALHKSLRNSDAQAALYWLGRMLEAGEDPLYIARRMVRFASEDIGLADPAALGQAMDSMQAVHFLGMPEGNLALAQAAVYLALAPKSNALYRAFEQVQKDVASTRNQPVPPHLRNAVTPLMQALDYGKGYRYAHDEPTGVADMDCLPESLQDRRYYVGSEEGFEREMQERMAQIRKKKKSEK